MAEEMVMSSSSSSGSRNKSLQCLVESIHSLLGFKAQLNSHWADSVHNIIKTLPSESPPPPPPLQIEIPNNDVDLGTSISIIKGELADLNASIYQLNTQRRQLLNHFLDLKGNIRVFCRVRPIMMGESLKHQTPVVAFDSSTILLNFANNKTKIYNFDKVFHPASSQDDIFMEVEQVLKSALDGYNACIFAYGQTGTGKTFTMEGTPDCPGVVPRAIEALFKQAADSNHKFLFHFSMLEMYVGHLKDLLIPQTKKATDPIPPRLSIQTDPKGEIEIENLVAIQVSDFNQAIRLYRLGCRFRSTASTNSNKTSSRSHCMIRMSMACFDATERRRATNKIWMVDLGGSERVLKTKAWGRRFEEGKAINLSISALGDVIYALQRKRGHIPYRNSKLTQVLKDSLGEDSKTLMLVHVSPTEEDLCETVCSLNFATRARSIHLGNEESDEARHQKEVSMNNLQQKMKQIEDKRDEFTTEIRKLNEKLENITRTSSSPNEAPHVPTEVPQSSTENFKRTATNVTAIARSSNVPRFMMPTVSSKRKTGIDQQTSKGQKELNHARRKKPSSCRAESVTFPIKGIMSECNSEGSVSRASCLVDLSGKNCNNVDNETECSQDTWDCDIKTEDNRSLRSSSSRQHMAHVNLKEGNNGNGNSNKFISSKFLKVNHWLHLHKNATTTTSHYTPGNKRVLAIPVPEKKNINSTELKIVDKLQDEEMYDYDFRKKKPEHDNITKLTDVIPTVLKNPFPTSGCITMTNDLSNDLSIEGSKHTATMQVITDERQCSEAFTSNSSLTSNFTGSVVDKGILDVIENELNIRCEEKVPTEMGTSREEEELRISAQNSDTRNTQFLYKLKLQRCLFPMDKTNRTDLSMTISESLGYKQKTGKGFRCKCCACRCGCQGKVTLIHTQPRYRNTSELSIFVGKEDCPYQCDNFRKYVEPTKHKHSPEE